MRARGRRSACLAGAAAAAAAVGCSVEKHYELLSFFFDGVPAPGEVGGPGVEGEAFERRAGGARSAHSAWSERRCSECHGETSRFGFRAEGFVGLDASVCLECHGDVLTATPYVHGPVAVKACLFCHEPHESPHEHLLVEGSPGLCLRCHDLQLTGPPVTPGHEPPSDCLTCHSGHGGADPYLLRPAEP